MTDQDAGVFRSFSDSAPVDYILRVDSFSLFTDESVAGTNIKCESGVFQAGGYNWKLVLYPNGNKKKNVEDNISVYLIMAGEDTLQPGEEIYVDFRLFLLNQITSKYLVVEDAFTKNYCFRGEKEGVVGFDKLISVGEFNDASNGYLIDDTCVFGAEVFVCNRRRLVPQADCLSIRKTTSEKCKFTWRVQNFSKLGEYCYSNSFSAGGHELKMLLYPGGDVDAFGTHLSLYLVLADPTSLPSGAKVSTNFCLRVIDQIHGTRHRCKSSSYVFSASAKMVGWRGMIALDELRSENNGFLRNDTCTLEAEVTVKGIDVVLNSSGTFNKKTMGADIQNSKNYQWTSLFSVFLFSLFSVLLFYIFRYNYTK